MSHESATVDVLIVDDEEAVCWSLRKAFTSEGWSVAVASSAEQGLSLCEAQTPRAILLDIRLPGMDGLAAMAAFTRRAPRAPIIVMTAYGQLATAVTAIEQGAFEYLTKPFDLDQALAAVTEALQAAWLAEQRQQGTAATVSEPADDLVGSSPAMQEMFKRIALAAQSDTNVLITGESGVGKDLVAQAIHRHSKRRTGPFLPIHVGALSESLVESELFGHVRGAFTGASEDRDGLLCLGTGGTVFLDEIAEVPLPIQVKLLRVLEQGEVLPVGSRAVRHPDIRIIAATHQSLPHLAEQRLFRRDLYYRLSVFTIAVPPLRERREDIPALVRYFAARCNPPVELIPDESMAILCERDWAGNVRELRNTIEAAAVLARRGPLLPRHLEPTSAVEIKVAPPGPGCEERLRQSVTDWTRLQLARDKAPTDDARQLYERLLAEVEPPLLTEVLRRTNGNRQEAADILGLNRATVRKKLGQYGMGRS